MYPSLSPSPSLNKLEFTGVEILLVILSMKKFVKQDLFCSNVNKIKKLERLDI